MTQEQETQEQETQEQETQEQETQEQETQEQETQEQETQEAASRQSACPLNSLYFYLTEGCNLACRHCWIAPHHQAGSRTYPSLDAGLFVRILDQAIPLGLSSVKLTGGEPLLHPQIGMILDTIKEKSLSLIVETNGVLCTPELAQKIAQCKSAFVSVSIDGAVAATHDAVRGVAGSFEGALEGLGHLVKAGLRPQVIMSVMACNRGEIEPLVRLAERAGAGSVKFNIVQPSGRGEKLHEGGETLSIQELVALGDWIERDLSAKTPLRLFYHHPAAFRPLGKILGSTGDGCGVCGILGILGVLSDGSYALCGMGETVPELIFGHAARHTLAAVWNDTPMLRELREGLPKRLEGLCGRCLMKGGCLGNCIAQNYCRSKSLWATYWYCDEAHRHGLFPETRLVPAAPAAMKEGE
jgi:SynChlorMet cassette radical SAM/SPASM protein ScmF